MFEHNVVIVDYSSRRQWPEEVRKIIESQIEYHDDVGQQSFWSMESFIDYDEYDEETEEYIEHDYWVDDVPVNSPVYKWLNENGVDYKKCYLHVWW